MFSSRCYAFIVLMSLAGTTVQALDESPARKGRRAELESCAYFVALNSIAYQFSAQHVKDQIVRLCSREIEGLAYVSDSSYIERQKMQPMCGNNPCISLTETPDEPNMEFGMIPVHRIVEMYQEQLNVLLGKPRKPRR